MVIDDDTDALAVNTPDFFVLVHITVKPKHIEEHVDGKDWATTHVEQVGLHHLLLKFVALEEARLDIDEIQSFFELPLLGKNLKVESDKLEVNLEIWLLHQFQQEQIGDVKNFRFEAQ